MQAPSFWAQMVESAFAVSRVGMIWTGAWMTDGWDRTGAGAGARGCAAAGPASRAAEAKMKAHDLIRRISLGARSAPKSGAGSTASRVFDSLAHLIHLRRSQQGETPR